VQASEARTGTPARTLLVDADGFGTPEDCGSFDETVFPSIQEAVDAAQPGDVVQVCPNVYPESVVIPKTLTVKGAKAGVPGAGRTFPVPPPPPDPFIPTESVLLGSVTIAAPGVTWDGFWLRLRTFPPFQAIGIVVQTSGSDAVVANNVIDNIGDTAMATNAVGIYLERGPDRVKVVQNKIGNLVSVPSAQGILIGDSTATDPSRDILISRNLIEDVNSTRGAYGILVNNGASDVTGKGFATFAIRDNVIHRLNGSWVHAIGLETRTPNGEVVGNSVSELTGISQDVAAVFVEANKFFPTLEVHRNNFNLNGDEFGIALHQDLIRSDGYRGKIDGTCNWWNASNGPGPVGPGSGARVTTNVDFDPWLDAPAPGGTCFDPHDKCDKDDDDDHDHDGKRNDKDEDVDNDGILNALDLDDDNDGIADLVDVDDDNDGIADLYDDKSTRQVQRTLHHTLGAGSVSEWMLASDGGALPLVGLLESPNAQFLKVEIYNPSGVLVGTSVPTPGVAVVTTSALLPGIYTVRVRNTGVAPIDYTTKLITTMAWF
jgi:hypothetical protein